MREILEFPKTTEDHVTEEKIEQVKVLIEQIAENAGEDSNKELEQLRQITGKVCNKMQFIEYWEWTDLEDIAKQILTPEPPRVTDLTETELEEIIIMI